MKPASPRIWFADFWHAETAQAIQQHNPFYHIVARAFDVRLDKNKPEFLLYDSCGCRFWGYDCIRIFCSREAETPDFANCDWAFSCDVRPHHGRNIYAPPCADRDWLAQRFEDIFAAPVPPVARRRYLQKHVLRHLPRSITRQLHKHYRKYRQALYQRAHGAHALIPDDCSSHDDAARN